MRIRAGVVLIEDAKVALIERYRSGLHYFVFPGGGVHEGETLEQAAVREMEEETGLRVSVKRIVVEIYFGSSHQVYFLAQKVAGDYGTGAGEEFTDADPDDPTEGVYIPVWMSLEELAEHENVYPADLAKLVLAATKAGWPREPIMVAEGPK
jgi:8-oxo-dGTP pyrophosphatase MutT (NUDIX family)